MQKQIPFEDDNQKGNDKSNCNCRSLRDDNQKGNDKSNCNLQIPAG